MLFYLHDEAFFEKYTDVCYIYLYGVYFTNTVHMYAAPGVSAHKSWKLGHKRLPKSFSFHNIQCIWITNIFRDICNFTIFSQFNQAAVFPVRNKDMIVEKSKSSTFGFRQGVVIFPHLFSFFV